MTVRVAVIAAFAAAIVLWLGAAAGEARAATVRCSQVEPDYFEIDGMLDDWSGHRGYRANRKNRDASFDLRCAYDRRNLYLSVNVRDDIMLRTRKAASKSEDHVHVQLKVGRGSTPISLRAFPGAEQGRGKAISPVRYWGSSRRLPKGVTVEDSLQQNGYAIEAAIPLARVRGFGKGTPGLSAKIVVADGDVYGKKVERQLMFRGTLELSGASAVFQSFLQQTNLSRKDLRLDELVNVDDSAGAERVVSGGKIVGVLGEGYHYFVLPASRAADVKRVKLVDLEGNGRAYVVAEYREYGNGGSRDVVGVWRFAGASFSRVFAFESRKQLGDNVLVTRWSFVPRGKHRKVRKRARRGHDLLLEAGEATGWDEDTYSERPAQDVRSILLPWEEQTTAVYWFAGGVVHGGDPAKKR